MTQNEENEDDPIKIILLGNAGVGKTNLINITMGYQFNPSEKTTTAASFSLKKLMIKQKEYKISLWDTIGQEKLRQLTKIFYNNSKIVIYVYDITCKESFGALPDWIKGVDGQIGNEYIKGLVANKSDLYFTEEVKTEEGQEFANNIKAKFLLFSAKMDDPKKFEEFLLELVEEFLSKKKNDGKRKFTLSSQKSEDNAKRKCC